MSSFPAIPEPAAIEKAPVSKFVVMCAIFTGLMFTEQISMTLLPLTISKLTSDPSIIGWIKFLNPMFGFISQPIVGWLSDRTWTPFGRRSFFLIVGSPIVGLSLWVAPELSVLWHLVVWVAIWQCFQDVLWGSDHPLMADLFPPSQRPLLAALMTTVGAAGHYIFLDVILQEDHVATYRIVAALQLALVVVFSFFLGEKRPKHFPKERSWAFVPLHVEESEAGAKGIEKFWRNLVWYCREIFANSIYTRFAIINFTSFMAAMLISEWVVLFATETLGLSLTEFKNAWKKEPLVTLFFALPAGWLIGKYCAKQWAMVFGFGLMMASCVYGYYSEDANDLMIVAIIYALGNIVSKVTYKPFFTEFLPAAKIGMLTGAFNIFYGLGRGVSNAGGGELIEFFDNNYRVMWIMAFVLVLVSAVVMATIPDVGFARRKLENQGNGDEWKR